MAGERKDSVNNDQTKAREPHDGWLNAWLCENAPNNDGMNVVWHLLIRKMAGDWADAREEFKLRASLTSATAPPGIAAQIPPDELEHLKRRMQWMLSNFCGPHAEIITMSSGPCPFCENHELKSKLGIAEDHEFSTRLTSATGGERDKYVGESQIGMDAPYEDAPIPQNLAPDEILFTEKIEYLHNQFSSVSTVDFKMLHRLARLVMVDVWNTAIELATAGVGAESPCGDEFKLRDGYFCQLPRGHVGDHESECPNPQFTQRWARAESPRIVDFYELRPENHELGGSYKVTMSDGTTHYSTVKPILAAQPEER